VDFSVDTSGFSRIVCFFGGMRVVTMLSAAKTTDNLGNYLMKKIRANASATCHSLKDFKYKCGENKYCYMYSIQNPNNPHPEKPYLVHLHSGRLVGSLQVVETEDSRGHHLSFGYDPTKCEWTPHVIYGTHYRSRRGGMIPRNFIDETIQVERGNISKMLGKEVDALHNWVHDLYMMARVTKWLSKFYGSSAITNAMFKTARAARNLEILSSGSIPLYGTRLYNTMVGGRIASQFMLKTPPGYAGVNRLSNAFINRAISKEIVGKYVFLKGPSNG